jgi:hypothetical protein
MKQLKIRLPDHLHEWVERAAAASERSLNEEVRMRLEASFEREGTDPETQALVAAVENLATLVKIQTAHKWHEHPAATRVLRHAITARLDRLKPNGEEVFGTEELPKSRLAAPGSDDPEVMALALEAIDFHAPHMRLEQSKMFEEAVRRLLQPEKGKKL